MSWYLSRFAKTLKRTKIIKIIELIIDIVIIELDVHIERILKYYLNRKVLTN